MVSQSAFSAKTYQGNPFYTMFYVAAKLHLSYLLGEYNQALVYAKLMGEIIHLRLQLRGPLKSKDRHSTRKIGRPKAASRWP